MSAREQRRRQTGVPVLSGDVRHGSPRLTDASFKSSATEELLLAGEKALLEQGDLAASRRWFESAARAALNTDDVSALARAALGLGGLWVHEHRTAVYAARVRTWQRQALERLDPSSRLAARLVARVAAESDYEQGTATAVLAAVDDARAGADAVLLADTLNLAHHCLLGPEHAEHRLALARELLAVSAVTGRVVDETLGLLWLTVDLLLAGDPHAGRPLRELRAANEAHGLRAVEYVLSAMDVMLAIRRGDLADAERQAAACVELGQAVGDVDASGWYGAHLSAIRWFQGRTVELIPLLTELAHSPTLAGPDDSFFAALAVAAAAAGDRPAAVHALRCLRRDGLGNLLRSSTWRVSLFGVIEAAHLLDDAQTAAEAYRLLEPYADQPIMASLAIVCFGSAHHPLGVAAETMGDLDLADRHLTAAVSANEVLGHLPAAALSSQRLAEVKRRQDELVRGGRGAMATCRRQGGSWWVEMAGHVAVVPDSVGMRHLAELLSRPGQDIAAVDLVGAPASWNADQPLLDEDARRAYGRRVRELQAEVNEAEDDGDHERETRARVELDWLLSELERVTGLGGRPCRFADDKERARTSVQKAIRRAVAVIHGADPLLGAELENRVVTGGQCSYQPAALGSVSERLAARS